jgi:hypothetical protein
MMVCTKALRASRLTSLSLVIGHSAAAAAFTSPATNASGDGGAVHFQGILKYSRSGYQPLEAGFYYYYYYYYFKIFNSVK